jgi:hypothetical protein
MLFRAAQNTLIRVSKLVQFVSWFFAEPFVHKYEEANYQSLNSFHTKDEENPSQRLAWHEKPHDGKSRV